MPREHWLPLATRCRRIPLDASHSVIDQIPMSDEKKCAYHDTCTDRYIYTYIYTYIHLFHLSFFLAPPSVFFRRSLFCSSFMFMFLILFPLSLLLFFFLHSSTIQLRAHNQGARAWPGHALVEPSRHLKSNGSSTRKPQHRGTPVQHREGRRPARTAKHKAKTGSRTMQRTSVGT